MSNIKKTTRTYNKWNSKLEATIARRLNYIKRRCYSEKYHGFKYYGGKGIKVCDEWLNDTRSFVNWALANGFKPELTIDRENHDDNYCPENCRWITQSKNSSRIDNKKYSDKYLKSLRSYYKQLKSLGYSQEESLKILSDTAKCTVYMARQLLFNHKRRLSSWE